MEKKENKYSYFVSYMFETRDRLMPGNIEVDVEERISGGDEIRKIEERIIAFYNGRLKDAGDDDRVEFLFITNFILLSGGESPALDEKLAVAGKALKDVKQIIWEVRTQGDPIKKLDSAVEIITKAQDQIAGK